MPRHRTVDQHGISSVLVRPGRDVLLIDVSTTGALVESVHQLRPGSSIEVHMTSGERRLAVRGRVLRCSVSRLREGGVWYRGAIGFDHHHPWFGESGDVRYPMPGSEMRPIRHGREDASRPVL